MQAHGWAVVDQHGINVRSVSPTRRAAIINWLVANCGMAVWSGASDAVIETWWRDRAGSAGASVVQVTITLTTN
jgi:hypothetical protein